jgi:hypothetical protein
MLLDDLYQSLIEEKSSLLIQRVYREKEGYVVIGEVLGWNGTFCLHLDKKFKQKEMYELRHENLDRYFNNFIMNERVRILSGIYPIIEGPYNEQY